MSGDCIPSANFHSIKTFPPAAKAPIIGLAVVFSVVVVVAVIVVVFLVRKISQLKKVGVDAGAKLKANAASIGGNIEGGIEGGIEVGGKLKEKLPDVNVDKLSVGVHAGIDGAYDKTVDIGGKIKAGLEGGLDLEVNLGLEVDNPFFTIFNALPYASVLIDTKGVIVRANLASNMKWGIPAADLHGRLYKTLVSPKGLEARLGAIDAVVKGNMPSFELDGFDIKIDGSAEFEIEVYGTIIHILGKAYIFIITGHVCFTRSGDRYK